MSTDQTNTDHAVEGASQDATAATTGETASATPRDVTTAAAPSDNATKGNEAMASATLPSDASASGAPPPAKETLPGQGPSSQPPPALADVPAEAKEPAASNPADAVRTDARPTQADTALNVANATTADASRADAVQTVAAPAQADTAQADTADTAQADTAQADTAQAVTAQPVANADAAGAVQTAAAPTQVEQTAANAGVAQTAAPTQAEQTAANAEGADAAGADAGQPDAKSGDAGANNTAVDATADADGEAAVGTETEAATEASADGKKKRRRKRRRKKKGDGAEAKTAEADGVPAPAKSKKKARPERPAFNIGDEVFGRVSQVTRHAVWLEVAGGKAHALFPCEELIAVPPKVGEQFIGKVKSFSTRGGMLMLGPTPFDTTVSRTELRAATESGEPLPCWVTGTIKGGLEIEYKGVRGFAPASHVELKPGADLSHLLGEKLDLVVTHYAKKGRDVVFSRKQQLEEEYTKERKEQLDKLSADMELKVKVRNVVQWGAFVVLPDEYGNIEGVVHMSEVSHNRSARVADVLKPGIEIDVKVLRIDDKGKLWLSHKAMLTDPWTAAPEKYALGTIHKGQVVRLTDFGAFVQLEPGIDGLCHVADLSFTRIEHPKDAVKEGEQIEVVIANIDDKAKKITLHPAPPEDERDVERIRRLNANQIVDVVVVKIKDNGLAVRVVGATGRHSRAFIHSGQTGTSRGTDLRKHFPVGTKLQAKVTDADTRRGDVRLSIRAMKADAEKKAYRDYRKKVQRESGFGTFGDLLKGKI